MKVHMNESELREVLRRLHTCGNGKRLISEDALEVHMDALLDDEPTGQSIPARVMHEALRCLHARTNGFAGVGEQEAMSELIGVLYEMEDEFTPICERHEPKEPEEEIIWHPELALDERETDSVRHEQIAELLRWCHYPEAARGRTFYVPMSHPSGLGGRTIYVPKDFPLPDTAALRPSKPSVPHLRRVRVDLTVTLDGKQWDVSHVPGVLVGQALYLERHPVDGVVASGIDAAGEEFVCVLTERNVG